MSEYVDFHYMPLEGKITGKQVLKQTEDAINDLGNKVYNLDIDESRIDEATAKSEQAINTANSALAAVTTDRAVWKNTVAEMKATDIDLGVTAATRGKMVFNDGNGAFYGVRSEKSGDVDSDDTVFLDNGNVAERIQSMNIIAKGNNIIFVANVAELIDSDALIGNVYGTAGYYSANDGGAGLYSIRAKTQSDVEDGGSIIFLDNGNVAELITDGTINVKQFGAYGDADSLNPHDDTLAFTKMMTFANRNWNGTPNGYVLPVIYIPSGNYLITDTWQFKYPCNVFCEGDIVYNGTKDRPAVYIGDSTVSSLLLRYANFRFHKILDYNFINNLEYADDVDYTSTNYVGIKAENLSYSNIKFDQIVGFTIGFHALAKPKPTGGGFFFNDIEGKTIRNCKEGFRVENDGIGWANANTVRGIFFETNNTIEADYDIFDIRVVHSNNSRFVMDSWLWDSIHFENASTHNHTCIYLKGCRGWHFRDYGAEVYNTANTNFCVIDLAKISDENVTERTVGIDFTPCGLDYGRISVINAENTKVQYAKMSGAANSYVFSKNNKIYPLLSLNKNDLAYDCIDTSATTCNFKKYRYPGYVYNNKAINAFTDHSASCSSPLLDKDGIYVGGLAFIIEVPAVNTTFKIVKNGSVFLKGYGSDFAVIDPSTNYIAGNFYVNWSGTNYIYVENANSKEQPFTVIGNNVKYIGVFLQMKNASTPIDGIAIYSDNPNAKVYANFDGVSRYEASTAPTVVGGRTEIGTKVYKTGSATNEYWELEKQADNSLAWVSH